ncbi:hypothetical protein [Tranquillimonas alkanivorans]|uniref:Uncharacterized protein n=1 Tax=Tranquillimonas alkanivorans TaxID=441119 RepID=A0A1I5WN06_9RHOB|nr:hypothetical protein [Tranquillimonas alkanivorans]SFQ20908.1 hypothetical protein SAMN04488047_15010 [Tranquillimonas alkanivorans]
MQWQTVQQNWPAFLERIEQRWPMTDEDDLLEVDGRRDRFVDYLSKVHDLTQNEANEQIDAWLMGEMPADAHMDDFRDNANIVESGRSIPPGEDVYAEDRDFGDDRAPDVPVGRND